MQKDNPEKRLNDQPANKRCSRCGRTKALEEFSRAKGPTGRHSYCKECQKEYDQKRKQKAKSGPAAHEHSEQTKRAPTTPKPVGPAADPQVVEAPTEQEQAYLVIEIGLYPEARAALRDAARAAVRSEEHQALFYILEGLKARDQARKAKV